MNTTLHRIHTKHCERRRVTDPFWASTDLVDAEVYTGRASPRWETMPAEGVFGIEEIGALAMVLATRDRDGRRWRHVYVGLPRPFDRDEAADLAFDFLGSDCAWMVGPRTDPCGANRVTARFHVCLDDPMLAPPQRASFVYMTGMSELPLAAVS